MANDEGKKCPVDHTNVAQQNTESKCPVNHKNRKSPFVYNVYSQKIDPTNNMPFNPNQKPAPGQKCPISTERVSSTIPKGGTDGETWTYPSPQMFFNALHRKGKGGDDATEGDMSTVVAIHNNMNERTWKQLLNWERLRAEESDSDGPKLLRFIGRPHDLSPLARVRSWMGWGEPFDRHDWFIDRGNDNIVRYVIDYYYDESRSTEDKLPELQSEDKVQSISVYVRPAVDSFDSFVDRIRAPVLGWMGKWPLTTPFGSNGGFSRPNSDTRDSAPLAAAVSTPAPDWQTDASLIKPLVNSAQVKCANHFEKLQNCSTPEECQERSNDLEFCMASVLCAKETAKLARVLESDHEVDAALTDVGSCMDKLRLAVATVHANDNVEASR